MCVCVGDTQETRWQTLMTFTKLFSSVHSAHHASTDAEAKTEDTPSEYRSIEQTKSFFATECHPPQFIKEVVRVHYVGAVSVSTRVVMGLFCGRVLSVVICLLGADVHANGTIHRA